MEREGKGEGERGGRELRTPHPSQFWGSAVGMKSYSDSKEYL